MMSSRDSAGGRFPFPVLSWAYPLSYATTRKITGKPHYVWAPTQMWPGDCKCRSIVELIGKRIGNYTIERPLAAGGMGAVFVARDHTLGRMAAVKFLASTPEGSADSERRFLDEARMTASLQHPNIVTIFDYGELDGRLYYIMELLAGKDLASLMANNRRFDVAHVNAYVSQIGLGLQAAHAIGIVHRDLKPSNIFVLDTPHLSLKLMDFGIAKVITASGDHTIQGQIVGTPHYMSPEQALGSIAEISPRSDIYALGIIAFEMLTGQNVFASSSPMMLLAMHIATPAPDIRDIVPQVPLAIAQLIQSCLAKNPRDRPQSALEVAERFEEALSERSARSLGEIQTDLDIAEPVIGIAQSALPMPRSHSERALAELTPAGHSAKRQSSMPPSENLIGDENGDSATPNPLGPATRALRLNRADRMSLNRLWLQMQESDEFPAFLCERWDAEKRSDFERNDLDTKLAESILRNNLLGEQLISIIGSAYADRFGSAPCSISHAILILGADRVRTIALSISLFGPQANVTMSARVLESSLNALVSGEIAQQFAPYASVSDAEQALMCGKFRNLGQHLACRYLPELDREHHARLTGKSVNSDAAAEAVFGISLRKFGLGVAERLGLPKPIVRSLSNVPGLSGRWAHEEDRMVALAEFSNALCALVNDESAQARPLALANLLLRHKALLIIDPLSMPELLKSVQESFERRYSSLLGSVTASSQFARNVTAMACAPASRVRGTESQMQSTTTNVMKNKQTS